MADDNQRRPGRPVIGADLGQIEVTGGAARDPRQIAGQRRPLAAGRTAPRQPATDHRPERHVGRGSLRMVGFGWNHGLRHGAGIQACRAIAKPPIQRAPISHHINA